jgi:hypothetical protein
MRMPGKTKGQQHWKHGTRESESMGCHMSQVVTSVLHRIESQSQTNSIQANYVSTLFIEELYSAGSQNHIRPHSHSATIANNSNIGFILIEEPLVTNLLLTCY